MRRKIPKFVTLIKLSKIFKETVSREFFSDFFPEASSPKPLKIIGSIQLFWKFAEILPSQGAPPLWLTPAAGVNYTDGKFSTSINDTSWYRWGRWYQWKIMVTISDCLHLKVNLRKKIKPYVISSTQRCPNNILYFLIEDFFHLPPVSRIELWISSKNFV